MNSNLININFEFLSELILDCNLIDCPYHPGLPLMETYNKIFEEQRYLSIEYEFGAGAQFIVSKTQILKRPKSFYEKIIKILEYSINPIEGYVIERFHGLIFNSEYV